jgi:hypothetical protein
MNLNPLKAKLVYTIFKSSVRTSKKTHFTITKIIWLMLFKDVITDYAENHTKNHKYIMPDHLLLKELVHIITIWR